MSHNSNTRLFDLVSDMVPAPLIRKLQAQGLSEFDIICKYKEKALDREIAAVDEKECPECGCIGNNHYSNCIAVN